MGKKPCCGESEVKKGAWSPEEDQILVNYIKLHGHGTWHSLPKQAGLLRCGKSCRLRWANYLRPGIKRGHFSQEEDKTIIRLHSMLGNRWAAIASQIPGRTDNEIKNYWNTHLKKRMILADNHKENQYSSSLDHSSNVKIQSSTTRHMVQWETARLEAEVRLSMESSLLNSLTNPIADHFLILWNSEVGKSFREVIVNGNESQYQNPVSQTRSVEKLGYMNSSVTTDMIQEQEDGYNKPKAEEMMASSDLSSLGEPSDCANPVSELLLDFPSGYDLDFFEFPR